jgi:hypothetical protein
VSDDNHMLGTSSSHMPVLWNGAYSLALVLWNEAYSRNVALLLRDEESRGIAYQQRPVESSRAMYLSGQFPNHELLFFRLLNTILLALAFPSDLDPFDRTKIETEKREEIESDAVPEGRKLAMRWVCLFLSPSVIAEDRMPLR